MGLVEYEVDDRLAFVTLNRPEKLNAINNEMADDLFRVFEEVRDDSNVWGCMVTGEGRAFSSGHDLTHTPGEGETRPVSDIYQVIQETWKPCFAAINGLCLAGGAGIALSCDMRVMAEDAQIGWPQVKRGISSTSGPLLLANMVPVNVAYEYLLTGEFVNAEAALRLCLVNRVVPTDLVKEETERLARKVLSNAPLAVQAIKEVTVRARDMTMQNALRFSDMVFKHLLDTEDAAEGLQAFREKRTPSWQGR